MLRLGDIRYLNSWPVTYALRKGILSEKAPGLNLAPIQVVSGTPADLNRRLLMGELDASSVSSILYLRHQEEFVPVPRFCIRSESGVHSVLVVSRRSLEALDGKKIGVSNEGATTPILLELLLRRRELKIRLEATPLRYPEILQEYPAALLIGDEALQASQSSEDWVTWDLGEAWAGWTKAPFVYALWVVRRPLVERDPGILEKIRAALAESHEWATEHEAQLLSEMRKQFPFEANFLKKYLAALSYRLDEKAWEGLRRFSQEAEKLGALPKGTAARTRKNKMEPVSR
ncbi:MAG: menaquinone biosynthesis protein [Candidatus Omnitrophica bacterium]|nr:menaquinone biosynthesis protein [Candidatus Omnitrophota bacterium]